MREATGEANMVLIVIVLLGVVAAAGVVFIPRLMDGAKAQSCCVEQGGSYNSDSAKCEGGTMDGKTVAEMKRDSLCQ